jgi:hypothetical protein
MLESSLSAKPTVVRKARPSRKTSRPNIDDTETEDDSDNVEATVGRSNATDEWTAYLSTTEDVPDDMGVVRWWGVSCVLFHSYLSLLIPYVL